MARPLIVEGEPGAVMADLHDPLAPLQPLYRRRHGRRRHSPGRPDRGAQRILEKGRGQVHQHQFLMLMLVIEAERDQIRGQLVDRAEQGRVHRRPPVPHLVERRPGDHPSLRARVPLAFALIIRVEEVGVALVIGLVASQMIAQHEGFEEPGGVGQMPFRRRGVGHWLERGIRVRERRGDGEAEATHRRVARCQIVAGFRPGLCRHCLLPMPGR